MKLHFFFISLISIVVSLKGYAQHNIHCFIKNGADSTALSGATVSLNANQAVCDSNGLVVFKKIKADMIHLTVSHAGFETYSTSMPVTAADTSIIVYIKQQEKELDEVIVSSFRNNSRVEDLPTKVEVLGAEEVGEENGIKPGNIASLLGDIAGIQIQQTNAATGNADARVQGLPGKYTQLLKDGMPLFGGYSGSFSILQVPPADLKQIEIVKGASSTLYGGGAIAGMINLVSKSPRLNKPERQLTINQSTLKESNLNSFFSYRNNKWGYTLFSGATIQKPVDVNKDGLSDVADITTYFLHPRFFFYGGSKRTLILGYSLTSEKRKGGDMLVLQQKPDAVHRFFISNQSLRHIAELEWDNKFSQQSNLRFKASTSFFNRKLSTPVFGMKANQLSWYSELSWVYKQKQHQLVSGINFNGEKFSKQQPDSLPIAPYSNNTAGLFIQDDWKLSNVFTIQSGLRWDHHNRYGDFVLPRISLMYKLNQYFTTRLGGGLGYKTPEYFSSEIDERNYGKIIPNNALQAERSSGINWDINFQKHFNEWHLTINQLFFITNISKPLFIDETPGTSVVFSNKNQSLNTKGFETYIMATHDELEIYFGYTYTNAKQLYNTANPNLSLSARHKFATVIAYEFSEKFRAGIEAAYTGKQYLDNGTTTTGYLFAAAMMRYNFKNVALVLNCENLFDYRQTKKESIYTGTISNPVFKQVWAPLDGRVINLSAKIDF